MERARTVKKRDQLVKKDKKTGNGKMDRLLKGQGQ